MSAYERMFGNTHEKSKVPMTPGDHPEMDDSPLLNSDGIKQFQSMIGMLQWAVSIGRFDIHCAVMTMGSFRAMPREGHLKILKKIFAYLNQHKEAFITFNTEIPDYKKFKIESFDWYNVYEDSTEELPPDMPNALGKPERINTFVDANLMHDLTTGNSATGFIQMLNKTYVDWYSEKQSTVESSTYGSEFMAARIAVEQIMDLRYTLRMMGVPLDGPAWMFGDNESVITSATIPASTLKKRHNAIAYHRVREAIACGIVNFIHIKGENNPADVLTKHLGSWKRIPLLQPLLSEYDHHPRPNGQIEGSVNPEDMGGDPESSEDPQKRDVGQTVQLPPNADDSGGGQRRSKWSARKARRHRSLAKWNGKSIAIDGGS